MRWAGRPRRSARSFSRREVPTPQANSAAADAPPFELGRVHEHGLHVGREHDQRGSLRCRRGCAQRLLNCSFSSCRSFLKPNFSPMRCRNDSGVRVKGCQTWGASTATTVLMCVVRFSPEPVVANARRRSPAPCRCDRREPVDAGVPLLERLDVGEAGEDRELSRHRGFMTTRKPRASRAWVSRLLAPCSKNAIDPADRDEEDEEPDDEAEGLKT